MQRLRGRIKQQINPPGCVEAFRLDQHALQGQLAREELLGQRRSLIRGIGLAAYQGQAARKSPLSQRSGRLGAGLARPQDDEMLAHC